MTFATNHNGETMAKRIESFEFANPPLPPGWEDAIFGFEDERFGKVLEYMATQDAEQEEKRAIKLELTMRDSVTGCKFWAMLVAPKQVPADAFSRAILERSCFVMAKEAEKLDVPE